MGVKTIDMSKWPIYRDRGWGARFSGFAEDF